MKKICLFLIISAMALSLTACGNNTAAPSPSASADNQGGNVGENVGDAVKDVGEGVGKGVEDVGDAVGDGVKDLTGNKNE